MTLKDSGPLASHALGRVHAEATLLGGPSAKASVKFLSQTPFLGALKTALQSDSVLVLLPWPQVHKTTGDLCLGAPSVCTPPALTAFPWEEEVTEAASSFFLASCYAVAIVNKNLIVTIYLDHCLNGQA